MMKQAAGSLEVSLDRIIAEGNIREFSGSDEAAKQFTDSVRTMGVLEPVLLTQAKGKRGWFQLVAGFRRYGAACEAGLDRIPARVLPDLTDGQIIEIRLTENFNRMDMNPMEEARGLVEYMRVTGQNQSQVAKRLGRSDFWVSCRVRLLDLPMAVQEMVEGKPRNGHTYLPTEKPHKLPLSNAVELLPYIAQRTDDWMIRAAEVGCWKGVNQSFKSALAGDLETVRGKGAKAILHSERCDCMCRCCQARVHRVIA
ncbi:MAG: ParB/RepB/Spo0J family partition protein [Thermoplasmata archaeon]